MDKQLLAPTRRSLYQQAPGKVRTGPGVNIDAGRQSGSPGVTSFLKVTGLRWHEQPKAYAAPRMEEGRSEPVIMRCLKRFIAREVFHTLLGRPAIDTTAV